MKRKNHIMRAGIALYTFLVVVTASASEVTGTLSTGLGNSSVTGIVVSAPTANPVAGTYTGTQSVALASSGSINIRYTTDGSTPTCTTGAVYSSPLSVSASQTITAIACYANGVTSSVSSHAYVIVAAVSSGGGSGGGGGGSSSFTSFSFSSSSNTNTQTNTTNTSTTTSGTTSGQVLGSSTTSGQVAGVSAFTFLKDLRVGSKSGDVTELQKVLVNEGFLKVKPTGYFGTITKVALINWQKKYKLPATGFFGPMSRSILNSKLN